MKKTQLPKDEQPFEGEMSQVAGNWSASLPRMPLATSLTRRRRRIPIFCIKTQKREK